VSFIIDRTQQYVIIQALSITTIIKDTLFFVIQL